MRKLLIAFAAVFAVITMNAQNAKFGVTAGITIANQKFKSSGLSITGDSKVGFTAGAVADVGITENFSFQPGLNFTQKGSKVTFDPGTGSQTSKQTLNYIELPLNFLYKAPAGAGKFFAGLGPVLSYGISGKAKDDGDEFDIHFGSDTDDDYKAFEFSGNVLAGYELAGGFLVAVNYNLGFSDILNGGDSDESVKNKYFGIRIGYLFGGSK